MHRPLRRFGAAIAVTAAAVAVVRLLHPILDAGSYMVLLGAVLGVAVFAGLGPALLATVLAVLAIDFFFLAPRYSLALIAAADVLLLAVFSGLAALASWLTEVLRRRQARAESAAREAAALASLFKRDADELGHEVDAMHRLRAAARRPPGTS